MLDKQIVDVLLCVEKKYSKLRTGEISSSHEVSEASERWYAQRITLKMSKGKRVNLKELNRLENE